MQKDLLISLRLPGIIQVGLLSFFLLTVDRYGLLSEHFTLYYLVFIDNFILYNFDNFVLSFKVINNPFL